MVVTTTTYHQRSSVAAEPRSRRATQLGRCQRIAGVPLTAASAYSNGSVGSVGSYSATPATTRPYQSSYAAAPTSSAAARALSTDRDLGSDSLFKSEQYFSKLYPSYFGSSDYGSTVGAPHSRAVSVDRDYSASPLYSGRATSVSKDYSASPLYSGRATSVSKDYSASPLYSGRATSVSKDYSSSPMYHGYGASPLYSGRATSVARDHSVGGRVGPLHNSRAISVDRDYSTYGGGRAVSVDRDYSASPLYGSVINYDMSSGGDNYDDQLYRSALTRLGKSPSVSRDYGGAYVAPNTGRVSYTAGRVPYTSSSARTARGTSVSSRVPYSDNEDDEDEEYYRQRRQRRMRAASLARYRLAAVS